MTLYAHFVTLGKKGTTTREKEKSMLAVCVVWLMSCGTLCRNINVGNALLHDTYLNVVEEKVSPCMATFPIMASAPFTRTIRPVTQHYFKEMVEVT